ncbi:hypothetical protein [Actinomyces trachealis]|uniref:hypothetical protein n=1 Tax=Actinomyces trachealis TaxID=2763540 RepID=UPI001892CCDC|nr:hypothetical protein [Actinomyces trachealis]
MEAARLPLSGGNGIIVNVVVSVLQVGVGAVLAVRSVTRGGGVWPADRRSAAHFAGHDGTLIGDGHQAPRKGS